MSYYLISHSRDTQAYLMMDESDDLFLVSGNDTKVAPWRLVKRARDVHDFVEPPQGIFKFPTQKALVEYLDGIAYDDLRGVST